MPTVILGSVRAGTLTTKSSPPSVVEPNEISMIRDEVEKNFSVVSHPGVGRIRVKKCKIEASLRFISKCGDVDISDPSIREANGPLQNASPCRGSESIVTTR